MVLNGFMNAKCAFWISPRTSDLVHREIDWANSKMKIKLIIPIKNDKQRNGSKLFEFVELENPPEFSRL